MPLFFFVGNQTALSVCKFLFYGPSWFSHFNKIPVDIHTEVHRYEKL